MVIAGDGCTPDYLPEGYPRQGKLELPNPNYLPTADSRWKGRAADLSTENELHPGAGRVPLFAVLLCQMDFRGSGSRLPTERGEERNHLSKKTEHPTRGSTVWLTHNGFAIRSALTFDKENDTTQKNPNGDPILYDRAHYLCPNPHSTCNSLLYGQYSRLYAPPCQMAFRKSGMHPNSLRMDSQINSSRYIYFRHVADRICIR